MWPGGPPRSGGSQGEERARRRLPTVEERASRLSERSRRTAARRRARRVRLGFGLALLLSGLGGWVVGRSANRTQAELTEERAARQRSERSATEMEDFLRGEAAKVIQNMWLTEIMEAQRAR